MLCHSVEACCLSQPGGLRRKACLGAVPRKRYWQEGLLPGGQDAVFVAEFISFSNLQSVLSSPMLG